MINTSNVKSNLNPNTAITPFHSDIESYCYATDDIDRYSDYLSDKWTLEAELQTKNLNYFQA